MTKPMRAADFIDSIGINVHVEYTDGEYRNPTEVIKALNYLGITNVRDAAVWSKNQGQANYDKLAQAGIKFNMFLQGGRDPAASVAAIEAFVTKNPGAVNAIEGPNEINNWPLTYQGMTGKEAGQAFVNKAAALLDASKLLDPITFYSLTGANVATDADYANFHAYPKNGAQPYNTLLKGLGNVTANAGKPIVLTEAGYYTAPMSSDWGGVDDLTQAKLNLNLLMDATKLGIERTYLYQLLDAYKDPTGLSVDKNMGLFDVGYKAKPAATAIHNLTTILSDKADNAATFQTHDLAYTVKGLGTEGDTLALQKASGVHNIVVWNEPDIWDEKADVPIVAASKDVTLDFGSNHVSVLVYDPLVSDKAIASYGSVTSLKLGVTDHPLIVEVTDIPDPVVAAAAPEPVAEAEAAAPEPLDEPTDDLIAGLQARGAVAAVGGGVMSTKLNAYRPDYVGGGGRDQVYGDAQDNVIIGGDANDILSGGAGDDLIYGGADDDRLSAGDGKDKLYGGDGKDRLTGGKHGSELFGGDGDDTILGGAGDDLIVGGAGRDSLRGNGGKDLFRFEKGDSFAATQAGLDIINYWSKDDMIDLGVRGTAANYAEAKVASFDAAKAFAATQFAAGKAIAAAQVGSNVIVFAETDAGHAGYDVGIVLDHASLPNIGFEHFV